MNCGTQRLPNADHFFLPGLTEKYGLGIIVSSPFSFEASLFACCSFRSVTAVRIEPAVINSGSAVTGFTGDADAGNRLRLAAFILRRRVAIDAQRTRRDVRFRNVQGLAVS